MLVIGYVATVLLVDTLATASVTWPIRWSLFTWKLGTAFDLPSGSVIARFDLFKFVFWLLIPLAVALPRLDWRYLLATRWTRWDIAFVAVLGGAGMAAMFLIPRVPELQEYYPSLREWPAEVRVQYFFIQLIWVVSWLPGWEFLHRYVLLRTVQPSAPEWRQPLAHPRQWGWLLVPVFETLYHLQKAPLEAAGMFVLSTVLTLWCLKRGNWLIAFVVHLIIEVELLIFMTLLA